MLVLLSRFKGLTLIDFKKNKSRKLNCSVSFHGLVDASRNFKTDSWSLTKFCGDCPNMNLCSSYFLSFDITIF